MSGASEWYSLICPCCGRGANAEVIGTVAKDIELVRCEYCTRKFTAQWISAANKWKLTPYKPKRLTPAQLMGLLLGGLR